MDAVRGEPGFVTALRVSFKKLGSRCKARPRRQSIGTLQEAQVPDALRQPLRCLRCATHEAGDTRQRRKEYPFFPHLEEDDGGSRVISKFARLISCAIASMRGEHFPSRSPKVNRWASLRCRMLPRSSSVAAIKHWPPRDAGRAEPAPSRTSKMAHAVQEGQDRGIWTDRCGERVDGGIEVVGFATQQNQVERAVQFMGLHSGWRFEGHIAKRLLITRPVSAS